VEEMRAAGGSVDLDMDSLSAHHDYGSLPLNESDLDPDPFAQFAVWLADAEAAGLSEPNAMVLATVDADGSPGSRTVLLRGVHEGGLEFFTNYDSRKGQALSVHPVASAVFPWYSVQRQVIVSGAVTRVDPAESDAYFGGRPHASQLAAVASRQSREIDSREQLERRMIELAAAYPEGTAVPRPEQWGGYRLTPSRIEFWKGRRSRLHDRFVYARTAVDADASDATGGSAAPQWSITRLQP
jgi:pyridoxamine 5'-phosphate oxidase